MLSKKGHDVTVIAYTTIPEKIYGVKIIKINKNLPLPIRVFLYLQKLWFAVNASDIIYSENGASVELPIYIVSLLKKKKFFIHIGDKIAYERSKNNPILRYIQNKAFRRSKKIIKDTPLEKPEIHPFKELPKNALANYKESWEKHIQLLLKTFNNE